MKSIAWYSLVVLTLCIAACDGTPKTEQKATAAPPPVAVKSAADSTRFAAAMKTYYTALASMPIDDDLLESIAHYLEPSIYDPSVSSVNCNDKAEKERIKTEFMIGKLGCEPKGKNLETAIEKVCDKMTGIKDKQRVVFYYLLVVQEDMASKFLN
jgi:hypothetical protein